MTETVYPRECELIEARPGEWFCLLRRLDAPPYMWNWYTHADCYGPFPTPRAAGDDLRKGPLPHPGDVKMLTHNQYTEAARTEDRVRLIANAKPSTSP